MKNAISPSYILDLVYEITEKLYKKYPSYKKVERYIRRLQKVVDYEQYGYNERYPIYNFELIYKDKDNEKIDALETLSQAPDEIIIQIAVDIGVKVQGIIYSIAKIEGIDKNDYANAKKVFNEAIQQVFEKPDEAIGYANSALESIIKHILEQGKLDIEYNNKDTLYNLTQKILKGFKYFPSKEIESEVSKIGSSLLCIAQAIEAIRSEKTNFHGKDSSQHIIDDPLYACFVVNCVATVGNFLINYYETRYAIDLQEQDAMDNYSDLDIPF